MEDANLKILEQRITRLEKTIFGHKGNFKVGSDSKGRQSKEPGFSGATGGVRFLISKRHFKKKLGLSEVRATLAKHEYHYSAQAVQMALNRLTRKDGPLVALREGGRKVYVERK